MGVSRLGDRPEYTNSALVGLISERIHKERDRFILFERLVQGLTYERIAELHDMSVSQIKRIIYKGETTIFR